MTFTSREPLWYPCRGYDYSLGFLLSDLLSTSRVFKNLYYSRCKPVCSRFIHFLNRRLFSVREGFPFDDSSTVQTCSTTATKAMFEDLGVSWVNVAIGVLSMLSNYWFAVACFLWIILRPMQAPRVFAFNEVHVRECTVMAAHFIDYPDYSLLSSHK